MTEYSYSILYLKFNKSVVKWRKQLARYCLITVSLFITSKRWTTEPTL